LILKLKRLLIRNWINSSFSYKIDYLVLLLIMVEWSICLEEGFNPEIMICLFSICSKTIKIIYNWNVNWLKKWCFCITNHRKTINAIMQMSKSYWKVIRMIKLFSVIVEFWNTELITCINRFNILLKTIIKYLLGILIEYL